MAARFLNNVRVRCKEGCEDNFIAVTKQWVNPDGMLDAYWAKTGERSYCFVGLWESEEKLVAAAGRTKIAFNEDTKVAAAGKTKIGFDEDYCLAGLIPANGQVREEFAQGEAYRNFVAD